MAVKAWNSVLEPWYSVQVKQDHLRWKQFKETARNQSCLQHTTSLVYLGAVLVEMIYPYLPSGSSLDRDLLHKSFLLHDLGESELGSDILYQFKSDERDKAEYEAFCKRYNEPAEAFRSFQRAFLLQFAPKNPVCFPSEAREIMRELIATRFNEALIFMAGEHWDYLLYAYEQFKKLGQTDPLVEVAKRQIEPLDWVAARLPGFKDKIWTEEARKFLLQYLPDAEKVA